MTTRHWLIISLGVMCAFLAGHIAWAQDDIVDSKTNVYVTTQDYSSLRAGPSTGFRRITIVEPGVTLRAIGRSATANWIQVEYEGQYGWIAARLLVWSGDMISLPIDGVNPLPFARRALVVAVTVRETPYYYREVTPVDLAGTLPAETRVELTGRLGGTGGYFAVQFEYNDQLYWAGSWNFRLLEGSRYSFLLDTIYLYAFGRLGSQLRTEANTSTASLSAIAQIWESLNTGQSVSCNTLPAYAGDRRFSEADLLSEPLFIPAARALDQAIQSTNAAVQRFADACARTGEERYITPDDIQAALDEIADANRNFTLVYALLASLAQRDPVLNRGQQSVQ